MHATQSILLSALLLHTSHLALAGTPINETRPVNSDAHIEVSNVQGAVTINAWDKPQISISGTLGEGSKALSVEGDAAHLVVKVEVPHSLNMFNWGGARIEDTVLDIKVPPNVELSIDVVSAEVSLSGVAGRALSIDSVSGDLKLDSGAGELDIDSVSGDVDLKGQAKRAHLETVSGDLHAHGVKGDLSFETVSGDITIEAVSYSDLNAGTVSGNIDIQGRPEKNAHLDIETMSGDVHIAVPTDLSARIRAESFSGRLRSDFGQVQEEEHGPGSHLDTTVGSGDARISVESFSGNVNILKQ